MRKLLLTMVFTLMTLLAQAQQVLISGGQYNEQTGKTEFAVLATPKAKQVLLRIYKAGLGGKPIKTIKMYKLPPLDFCYVAEV